MTTLKFTIKSLACLLGFALQPAMAATFVVTNNADSGDGSLRWALTQAATTPVTSDTINFNLPPDQLTISPLTNLPNVFYAIVDARTQPGYAGTPIVRLDGSSNTSVSNQHGFSLGNNGLVAGFSIVNFRDYGIISIGSASGIAGTVGCFVGVQPDGVTAGANGIGIWVNGLQSIIGGVGPTFRNVISGNTNAGIDIWTSASDIHVSNNYIGTTADGLAALPNGTHGVHVRGTANLIGDVNADERNIISGNTGAGVYIEGNNNSVLGNWIGLNVAGNALPNHDGVITYGSNTRIGDGVQPAGGNVISGNTGIGVFGRFMDGMVVEANRIGTDPTGLLARGNGTHGVYVDSSTNVSIGGTISTYRNVISGNATGVDIRGVPPQAPVTTANVTGNFIGVGIDGSTVIGNVTGSTVFAGQVAFTANVVSGNSNYGLSIRGGEVMVQNNLIGTDAGGTLSRANATGISGGDGKMTIDGNIIAGNGNGILINGPLAEATIVGNRLGVTATDAKLANGGSNIRVVTAKPGLVIGAPGNGNRIGASLRGIYLDATSDGVIIQSNYIGWIPAPSSKDIGHSQTAIYGGGRNHQIGGNSASKANIISRNGATAIQLSGTGHRIQGNFIGTDAAGTAGIGNHDGIDLGDASDVLVGGTATAEGNVIRNNSEAGVRIRGQTVSVLSNRIYGNGQIPIDLVGLPRAPDPNDADDHDAGSNDLQNYPVIESASASGSNTLIQARLRSLPNHTYKVQFFSAAFCNLSGLGEGATLLGSVDALTDGNGVADVIFSGPTTSGTVTSTATDDAGNTSEFGNCVNLGALSTGQFRLTNGNYFVYEDAGELVVPVTRSGGTFGPASVTLSTQNDTATAGLDYVATSVTLNFANGEVTKVVRIPLIFDTLAEGIERFFVNLTNPTAGATLYTAQATVVLYNSDPLSIRVASSDIGAVEPVSGQSMATFTVTMGPHTGERTISYFTEDLTAQAGSDYEATSGDLVFAAGETSKTINVPVNADNILESPEHFVLRLSESDPDVSLAGTYYYATIENTSGGGGEELFQDGFE
jgi:hypothetical protein